MEFLTIGVGQLKYLWRFLPKHANSCFKSNIVSKSVGHKVLLHLYVGWKNQRFDSTNSASGSTCVQRQIFANSPMFNRKRIHVILDNSAKSYNISNSIYVQFTFLCQFFTHPILQKKKREIILLPREEGKENVSEIYFWVKAAFLLVRHECKLIQIEARFWLDFLQLRGNRYTTAESIIYTEPW